MTLVEEIVWLLEHPITATRWWFRRLVIQRLNGERAAARRYERTMGIDPYENFKPTCPYDGTELVAPWQRCPICGRND